MSNIRTIADYVKLVNEADLVPTAVAPAVALAELVVAVENERNARSRLEVDPHVGANFIGATVRLVRALAAARESLDADRRVNGPIGQRRA